VTTLPKVGLSEAKNLDGGRHSPLILSLSKDERAI